MAKITVKAVTRLQKFLAAIAGDGVAPNPITDKEKLLHNIAENVNNGGGSGGGVLVVTDTDGTLDKTWTEIYNGMASGVVVITNDTTNERTIVTECIHSRDGYIVVGGFSQAWSPMWMAETADGYPTSV